MLIKYQFYDLEKNETLNKDKTNVELNIFGDHKLIFPTLRKNNFESET